MIRDDSFLNTGASSSSFAPKKVSKAIQSQKRTELLPAGTIVLNALDDEIAQLEKTDFEVVRALIYDGQAHSLEIEMLANEKAATKMKGLRKKFENLLRDNKDEA